MLEVLRPLAEVVDEGGDPGVGGFIEHFREGPKDLEHGAPCSGGVGKPVA